VIVEIEGRRFESRAIKYVTEDYAETQLIIAGYNTMASVKIPIPTRVRGTFYHSLIKNAWEADRRQELGPLPVSEMEIKCSMNTSG
jgi:hypothetical protein